MHSLIYLFQVSACMGIFYCCYYFLLRRFTFFTINRWYLLATLVASFVIPALTITVHREAAPAVFQQVMVVNQNMPVAAAPAVTTFQAVSAPVSSAIDWKQIIEIGYLFITVMLLVRLIIIVGKFFYKLKRLNIDRIGRVKVINGNSKLHNGSFLNYIFLDKEGLSAAEAERIFEHELLHAKFYHSVDRILVKLAQAVLWFNPFVYGYAYAIEENHEFEVDNEIGKRTDKSAYADMLLHLSINRQNILFNSFSKAPLKRRITMLFTKPTYHMKKITYLLVLPVVMISCLAFANLKNDVKESKRNSVTSNVEKPKGYLESVVQKVPQGVAAAVEKVKATLQNDVPEEQQSATANVAAPVDSLDNDAQESRLSVIKGVEKIKGKIDVLIDGKSYDSDILYKIGRSCISTTSISYGSDAANALVKIKTKNGEITYITAIDHENLKKERAVKPNQFYTRLHLRDNENKRYDEIIVNVIGGGSVTSSVGPNQKAGFYIDKDYYTEDQIEKNFPTKDKTGPIKGEYGVGPVKTEDLDKGVDVMFHFNRHRTTADTDIFKKFKTGNNKPAPAADGDKGAAIKSGLINWQGVEINYDDMQRLKKAGKHLDAVGTPFFVRSRLTNYLGHDSGIDRVDMHWLNGSAWATMAPDTKFGAVIDGVFYREGDLKKIPQDKVAMLYGVGSKSNSNPGLIEKGYVAPIEFKTTKPESAR